MKSLEQSVRRVSREAPFELLFLRPPAGFCSRKRPVGTVESVIHFEESFFPSGRRRCLLISSSPPTDSKCIFREGARWDWLETPRNSATLVDREPIEASSRLALLAIGLYHLEKKAKIFVKRATSLIAGLPVTHPYRSYASAPFSRGAHAQRIALRETAGFIVLDHSPATRVPLAVTVKTADKTRHCRAD